MSNKMEANELESLDVNGVGHVTSGMQLEHPVFGLGQVEAIFKFVKSGEVTIRINFEKHGSKALAPEYANLSLPKPKTQKSSLISKLFGRDR
ncbi:MULTISPECIES: hypothetical protein [Shewanella]|jgi:hypothetical protein|uniref:Uncharacterized protein n=1 Tax=Shewanella xiamenensis TaxID=332186 RepID=A0AAW6QXY1_9GAMM|nr:MULTISPECIES: hypothetical protein [Shewanella]MBW0297074.1 hypothetical protein [Shewanella xiamenensis]MDG5900997.1 hypothetical protein [Shewanella xiamenensis]MDH1316171.1 hypothetical protein [Shewanella xiamenensis]PHY62480.1 hypothetical protein CS023_11335 [Shewanella xiamenensis]QRK80469.1 hypothetical protein JM642_04960 [Shewanella sp. LZH-2]